MNDSVTITFELPRDVFAALRQDSEQFVQEMRLAAAVKWYEAEQISQAKAAQIAGSSRAEFLDALNRFGVTSFQVTAEDLTQEVKDD